MSQAGKSLGLCLILAYTLAAACMSRSHSNDDTSATNAMDSMDSMDSMNLADAAAARKGLTVSFYDPAAFSDADRCDAPSGANSSNGISPAEGLFGIRCQDNWINIDNPWTVQDVEQTDIDNAKSKGFAVTSKFDYLNLAFEKCPDTCVKKFKTAKGDTRYQINLPRCSNVCRNKTYKMKTTQTGDTVFKVFIEAACPARHWKNVFKAKLGIDNNHCGKPEHVDISKWMQGELRFEYQQQNSTRAYVY